MIGLYNVDPVIQRRLSESSYDVKKLDDTDNFPKLDGIFIDWTGHTKNKTYTKQVALTDHYRKDIPIMIYDRYMSIKTKEYEYLKKYNVSFYEPVLYHRDGFKYMPQWLKPLSEDTDTDNTTIDLGYKGYLKDKYRSFNNYFGKVGDTFDYTVRYDSNVPKKISDKYKSIGIKKSGFGWSDVRFTIAIDTEENYKKGHIAPFVLNALSHGCVVLLPIEHKYFGSMFHNLVVKHEYEINYHLQGFRKASIRRVVVEEVYENIEKFYPEFTIDYTIDIIKENMKKKG